MWTRYVCLIPDHRDGGGGSVWTRYVCLIPDHRDGGAVCGLGMSI